VIRDRRAILALLTGLNFLNYIDRAVIAAVVKPMKGELALSNFEAGLLSSAFMIGYLATSPLFAVLADRRARKVLIGAGVAIWSVATVASGLSTGFWSLFVARAIVGIGEASFTVLAPTIIDDITPPGRKGKALAVFFLAIPLGYALGYILGGSISHRWGWRSAFFVAGGPGVVLALTCLMIAEPPRMLVEAKVRLIAGLKELARVPLFRRTVLGYCVYAGTAGAFSYWAPNFLLERFHQLNDETANSWFGLVLIGAGAIGTFVGGYLVDRWQRRLPPAAADAPYDAPEHKAAVNVALRVCAVGMAVATPFTALCFFMPGPGAFFALAFVAEIGVFLSTSPISVATLRSVPLERRAAAMAGSVFAIHVLGDLWSAALLGQLQDVLPIVIAMMAIPLGFAWSAYVWWPRRREADAPAASGPGAGGLPEARARPAT
jgi:predicted MFS family arabinose efflux permease